MAQQLALDLVDQHEPGIAEGAAAAGCSPEQFVAGLSAMQLARSFLQEPKITPARRTALLRQSNELRRNRDADVAQLNSEAASGVAVSIIAGAMRRSRAWHAVYRADTARVLAEAAWTALNY